MRRSGAARGTRGGDPAPRSERHLWLLGRGVPGQDGQPYPTTHRGPRVRRDLSLKSEDVAAVCLLLATLPPHAYVLEIPILPATIQAIGKTSTAVRSSPRSGEHSALLEAPALRLRGETPTLAAFADEYSYAGSDALIERVWESGALSAGKVSAAVSSPRSTWRIYRRPIRPSVLATTRPASHSARGGSLPEYRSLRSGGTRFCDAGTFRTRMARRHRLYQRVGNRCGSPEAARGQSC